jgi:hypothetical protein
MRYWIAAALCAATMMSACVSQAADENVAVKLNERDREYRKSLRSGIQSQVRFWEATNSPPADSAAAALRLEPMNSAPSGAATMIHTASVRDG